MGKGPFSFKRSSSIRRRPKKFIGPPPSPFPTQPQAIRSPPPSNNVNINNNNTNNTNTNNNNNSLSAVVAGGGGGVKGKKKAGGARLWMRFDRFGGSELVECDKNAIIRRAAIPARDLRILGPVFSHSSSILAREKAMVVNLEFIKAIVTAEEVLLLDPLRQEVLPFADQLRQQLPQKRQSRIEAASPLAEQDNGMNVSTGRQWLPVPEAVEGVQCDLPFEFQVLEIALEVVCTYLNSSVTDLERESNPVLDELARNVSTKNLELVRSLKSDLTRLIGTSRGGLGRPEEIHGILEIIPAAGMNADGQICAQRAIDKAGKELPQEVLPFADQLRQQLPQKRQSSIEEASPLDEQVSGMNVSTGRQWLPVPEAVEGVQCDLPFEFQVLEIALEVVCTYLNSSVADLEREAYPVLDELARNVSTKNLELVRSLKSILTRLLARVQKVRDELEHLLDDNEDMAQLYLTRKWMQNQQPEALLGRSASNSISAPYLRRLSSNRSGSLVNSNNMDYDDVEDLEMLLEAYFMQLDGTRNKILSVREYIDDTEDYVNIQLDNQRNELIQLQLTLTIASFAIAVETVISGIFGMNIPCILYTKKGIFEPFVGGITAFSVLLFFLIFGYARWKKLLDT